MSETRARALQRVRRLVVEALGDRAARVYLFGSGAAGQMRRTSDIDVAIAALDPLPATFLADLRERLEESDVPYEIDLVDLAAVTPEFHARVEREGLRWRG